MSHEGGEDIPLTDAVGLSSDGRIPIDPQTDASERGHVADDCFNLSPKQFGYPRENLILTGGGGGNTHVLAMNILDIAEGLIEYGEAVIGDDLRTVVCYGRDYHNPIYTRDDIRKVINENARGAYRIPTWQVQRSALQVSRLFEGREDPEVIVRSYSTHHVLQFPISDIEGILFSFDCNDDGVPHDLLSGCKRIVYGSEGEVRFGLRNAQK